MNKPFFTEDIVKSELKGGFRNVSLLGNRVPFCTRPQVQAGCMAQGSNLYTWKVEAGGLEVQGHL